MIFLFALFLIAWVFVCCVVIGLGIERWWHERKNTTTLTVTNGTQFFAGCKIIIDPDMPDEDLFRIVASDGNTLTVKRDGRRVKNETTVQKKR